VSFLDWVWWMVSEIPGIDALLKTMSTGTATEKAKAIAGLALALIVGFAGSAEVIRWVLKWGFKQKSRMAGSWKDWRRASPTCAKKPPHYARRSSRLTGGSRTRSRNCHRTGGEGTA